MTQDKLKFFYHITIHRSGSMKTRCIETTSRVIEHHTYCISENAIFQSIRKASDKILKLYFVHQENKPHPIETPTLKVGLFCIGSYPKFIDGPK